MDNTSHPTPDYDAQSALYNRLADETTTRNKATVFDALAKAGIVVVTISFDGCSDSGQIENVQANTQDEMVALPSDQIEYERIRWGETEPTRSSCPLRDALEDLAFHYLSTARDGWKTATALTANSPSIPPPARLPSPITSASLIASIPNMNSRRIQLAHPYHHALSSAKNGRRTCGLSPPASIHGPVKGRGSRLRHRAALHHSLAYICRTAFWTRHQNLHSRTFLSDSSANNM